MKLIKITIILIQILFLISCNQKREKFYYTTQNQFTFIVLNKNSVKEFFEKNKVLNSKNSELKKMILDSLFNQKEKYQTISNETINFSKNTKKPNKDEYELSQEIIKATYFENEEKYFSGCLDYLFYYKCLPKEFQYKWTQTSLGHFEFNSTFFSILRDNSTELDKLIYGDIGNYDENLKKVFEEPLIFNEITPELAKNIKQTILSNEKFNDKRFEQDKLNFLLFLNKTIENKWRMILIDWN